MIYLSYFIGKNYFEEDGTKSYLVFQPIINYFKVKASINYVINSITDYVSSWQSKGLSAEAIKPPATSNNSLTPAISCYHASKIRVKFTGSCLKQDKVIFNHGKVVNIYIVYELGASTSSDSDPTIKNCLFGAVTLLKMQTLINIDILVMELHLVEDQVFHFQVVDLVKI